MAEKRIRRTAEQIAADYDKKIQDIRAQSEAQIAVLLQKKASALNPRKRLSKAEKLEAVFQQATRDKLSPEDLAELLGIRMDEAIANYQKFKERSHLVKVHGTRIAPVSDCANEAS